MPAPQAQQMKQLARKKFSEFQLKVPKDWQQPQGGHPERCYMDAFTQEEHQGNPAPCPPCLFKAASSNSYHVQIQEQHDKEYGKFIDKICEAICSAWSEWQSQVQVQGLVIAGGNVTGGQLIGPPINMTILRDGPSGDLAIITQAIATVLGTAWTAFTATVKLMTPTPLFMICPMPTAANFPSTPPTIPFSAWMSSDMMLQPKTLRQQMESALGKPGQFAGELFESVADAFQKCLTTWKGTTMFSNITGNGAVPTMMIPPPGVPAPGPIVAGVAMMAPGGLQ